MQTSNALFLNIISMTFQSHLTLTTRRGKLMEICTGQNMCLLITMDLYVMNMQATVVWRILKMLLLSYYKRQEDPKDEIFDIYGMQFYGMAPEICVGYSRLRRFGNNQTLKPEAVNVEVDPGSHDVNVVYLRGRWLWQREGVQYRGGGKEASAALIMKYNAAKRVHCIMGTSDGKPGKIEIKLDGNHLTGEQLGRDAKLESDVSIASIEWSFMHNLVRADKPETHEIEIIPRSDNFVFYTFVFG